MHFVARLRFVNLSVIQQLIEDFRIKKSLATDYKICASVSSDFMALYKCCYYYYYYY